jgi:hypothetical protein
LGTTLRVQPGVFGSFPSGLNAKISLGVVCSFPSQKAQNPPFFGDTRIPKSDGLFPLSTEMITHLPEIGSFLNSGIHPSMYKNG